MLEDTTKEKVRFSSFVIEQLNDGEFGLDRPHRDVDGRIYQSDTLRSTAKTSKDNCFHLRAWKEVKFEWFRFYSAKRVSLVRKDQYLILDDDEVELLYDAYMLAFNGEIDKREQWVIKKREEAGWL